jgi:hypothetical protein
MQLGHPTVKKRLLAAMALVAALALSNGLNAQQPPAGNEAPRLGDFNNPPLIPPEILFPPSYPPFEFEKMPPPRPPVWLQIIKFITEQPWFVYGSVALLVLIFAKTRPAADKKYTRKASPAKPPRETAAAAESESLTQHSTASAVNVPVAIEKEPLLSASLSEQELIERLGPPVRTFEASLAYKFAGYTAFFLLACAGVVGVAQTIDYACNRSWENTHVSTILALSVAFLLMLALIYGAVIGIKHVKRLRPPKSRIVICPKGLIRIRRGSVVGCRWSEITEARLWDKMIGTEMVFVTTTPVFRQVLTITREDGLQFDITPNHVSDFSILIEMIHSRLPLKSA